MCPLTDVGRDDFASAIIGVAFTNFSNANAHLGVGDSAAAFAKVPVLTSEQTAGRGLVTRSSIGSITTPNLNTLGTR